MAPAAIVLEGDVRALGGGQAKVRRGLADGQGGDRWVRLYPSEYTGPR
jgi:hypothetical protein